MIMAEHTITFTDSELNTIDVTLRMRLFMIQLELNDPVPGTSETHLEQLKIERNRIHNILVRHDVFINFYEQYMHLFKDND